MVDLTNSGTEAAEPRQEILQKLWQGKFIILVATIVTTAAAIAYYFRTTPTYIAQAVVSVKVPDKQQLIGERSAGEILPSIETDAQILKSYPLAVETVRALLNSEERDKLLLFGNNDGKKRAGTVTQTDSRKEREYAKTLQSMTRSESIRGTNLIMVSVSSQSPSEAALLANSLCKTYQHKDSEWNAAQDISISKTIEEQIQQQRNKVAAIEHELAGFMKNWEVYEATGNAEELQRAFNAAETEYNNNRVQYDILKKQLAFIEQKLSANERQLNQNLTRNVNTQLRSIRKNLTMKQNDYIALHMKKGADDPEVKAALERLNAAKAQYEQITRQKIAGELANTENAKKYRFDLLSTKIQASVKLAELDNNAEEYLKLKNRYQEQLNQLPQKQITFERLRLDLDVANRTLAFLKEKLDEARIKVASNSGRIVLLSPAIPPDTPDSPDLKQNIFLGICIGLAAGCGIVFGKDIWQKRNS